MSVPAELRYTAEHEWVALDGPSATIGITDFAARALGDVVYVSLPTEGAAVAAEEACGEVESTKSVSDLYSPVDGEVTEINGDLDDDPGLVNSDPYGAGWMFKVRLAGGIDELPPGLLSPAEYEELTKESD
ncbi:MAG TPA: glycine cleavage system protein GcvH [Streptosporangiaceae bacterium]|jgi:glycine cleavage system H protein|nr:glycine cleavage system protein GcvH [Streptosporangiaceae bacterium]